MFRKSLLGKMFVSYVIVIMVTLSAVGMLLSRLFADYYFSAKEAELVRKGEEIARLIMTLSGGRLRAPDAVWLNAMDRFLDARLLVVDSDGVIVATTSRQAPQGARLSAGEAGSSVGAGVLRRRGFSPRFQEPVISVVVPLENQGKVVGGLVLNAPVTGVNATVASVRRLIVYAAGGAIVLSFLVGYLLSSSLSGPLRQMSRITLEMAQGNFEQRVRISGDDEIGQLARNFNQLSGALGKTLMDLAEEKARVEGILTNMAEGVIAVNADREVIMMNERARRALGVDDAAVGVKLDDISGTVPLVDLVDGVLASGAPDAIEFNRAGRFVVAHASPLALSDGGTSGVVIVLQDVTEITKLEQLRQELLADVSHELRTPLSSIQAFAEALRDGIVKDETIRARYISFIHDETVRLGRMVHDLLDLSLMQSGKTRWPAGPVDVGSVVARVVEKFRPQAEQRGLSLAIDIRDNLKVLANEDRVEQAVTNLVDNAVKFTATGGRVDVSARELEGFVEVRIADTGPGIPEEDLPRIWERFYRVEKSRARTKGGAGLGLAIVKQIVLAHGGTVAVESSPEVGSVFSFKLPRA